MLPLISYPLKVPSAGLSQHLQSSGLNRLLTTDARAVDCPLPADHRANYGSSHTNKPGNERSHPLVHGPRLVSTSCRQLTLRSCREMSARVRTYVSN